MIAFELIYHNGALAWEMRTLRLVAQGDVMPEGWFRITRVVHIGPADCTKSTVEASDRTGRAHLGTCTP
jgi:hypothetical protein